MFRILSAFALLAALAVPAQAGLPGDILIPPQDNERSFSCVDEFGAGTLTLSGTVTVSDDPGLNVFVTQDHVAFVDAVADLEVVTDGVVTLFAKLAFNGSANAGVPSFPTGSGYKLFTAEPALPMVVETVTLSSTEQGLSAEIAFAGAGEPVTVGCQLIELAQ